MSLEYPHSFPFRSNTIPPTDRKRIVVVVCRHGEGWGEMVWRAHPIFELHVVFESRKQVKVVVGHGHVSCQSWCVLVDRVILVGSAAPLS